MPSTDEPEPSATEGPAASQGPPTPTELPPTSPQPEGVLFRDDFEGSFQSGWQWINENPDKGELVEFDDSGWLKIVGDKPGNFADQTNTRMRALPHGDIEITTRAIADPRQNHHPANIFIFEEESNYMRLNFGFCDHCRLSEGYGYFMETVIENNPFAAFYAVGRDSEQRDVYLRLVNQGVRSPDTEASMARIGRGSGPSAITSVSAAWVWGQPIRSRQIGRWRISRRSSSTSNSDDPGDTAGDNRSIFPDLPG